MPPGSAPVGVAAPPQEEEKKKKKNNKLSLSYRAHEIIARNSPYGHHLRSLLNAENFLTDKEFQMALDIYRRLSNKIPRKSIREKIDRNIKDIEEFLEDYEEEPELPQQLVTLKLEYPDESEALPQEQPPVEPEDQPQPFGSSILNARLPRPGGGGRAGRRPIPPENPENFEHPSPFTEDVIKKITDGIFEIQKAAFEGKNLHVESMGGVYLDGDSQSGGGSGAEEKQEEKQEETEQPGEPADSPDEAGGSGKTEIEEADSSTTEGTGGGEGEPGSSGESGSGSESEDDASPGNVVDAPQIPSLGGGGPGLGGSEDDDYDEGAGEGGDDDDEEESKPQEIRGVLELQAPEQEDTPFLTLTYDFTKIPHRFELSKDHNILEYAYYKYKPMLVKAQKFIKRKQITKALNYYRTIREQEIPREFKRMIDRNIKDITEYLEKYLMTRQA